MWQVFVNADVMYTYLSGFSLQEVDEFRLLIAPQTVILGRWFIKFTWTWN